MRTWTRAVAAAALATALGSLAACGSDDPDEATDDPTTATSSQAPTPSPTAEPTPSPTAPASDLPSDEPSDEPSDAPSDEPSEDPVTGIRITIKGDKVSPSGERIEVERGEEITLIIDSDRAGELHVHSKPEQYVEFDAGAGEYQLSIKAPGIVDIEDHDTGTVIVQLEVS